MVKKREKEETSLNGEYIRTDTTTALLTQTYGIACTVKVEHPSEGMIIDIIIDIIIAFGQMPRLYRTGDSVRHS